LGWGVLKASVEVEGGSDRSWIRAVVRYLQDPRDDGCPGGAPNVK